MSLVISAGLAFLLTLFIKEDLRRSKFISELKQELIDVYTDSFEGLPEELENLVSKL
jgi:hypothetical protein